MLALLLLGEAMATGGLARPALLQARLGKPLRGTYVQRRCVLAASTAAGEAIARGKERFKSVSDLLAPDDLDGVCSSRSFPLSPRAVTTTLPVVSAPQGDMMGALKEWDAGLAQSPDEEQRRELHFSSACVHAAFGDVELAKMSVRDAINAGLVWDEAVRREGYLELQVSTCRPPCPSTIASVPAAQASSSSELRVFHTGVDSGQDPAAQLRGSGGPGSAACAGGRGCRAFDPRGHPCATAASRVGQNKRRGARGCQGERQRGGWWLVRPGIGVNGGVAGRGITHRGFPRVPGVAAGVSSTINNLPSRRWRMAWM